MFGNMWLDENPEWRYTAFVLAICIVINATLPIWLGIANCCDHRKNSKNAKAALDEHDSDSEADGRNNHNRGNKQQNHYAHSVVSDDASSLISSQVSAILEARPGKRGRVDRKKRRKRERDIRSAVGMPRYRVHETTMDELEIVPGNPTFESIPSIPSPNSILSRLNTDDFSINEGIHAGQKLDGSGQYVRRTCCQALVEVSQWDSSLASLAGFYMVQGVVSAVNEIVKVAIISHAIGLTEANAYIMVSFLITLTFTMVAGSQEGMI